MPKLEQQKQKRHRLGFVGRDAEQAFDGSLLYTPMFGDGTVYLLDTSYEVVHTWKTGYRPGLYGYLIEEDRPGAGNLFYGAQVKNDDMFRFKHWRHFKGGAVLEMDWNGNVLWKVEHPDHHHDARKLKNGNVLMLCSTVLPEEFWPRVKGGEPGSEDGGRIHADYIVETTTSGEEVWRWNTWEHLDFDTEIITLQDHREEWTHSNTVAETVDGHILLSCRNVSTVVMIDRASGDLLWKYGPPNVAQQHDPRPLPNGNVTIFDNGTHRLDMPFPFSRVLEVDPRTNRVVWAYVDRSLYNFFSPYCSSAQRLPNGNTHITETAYGRMFEVTPAGEIVAEYINPHIDKAPMPFNDCNWVFRSFKYGPDEIERAKRAARR